MTDIYGSQVVEDFTLENNRKYEDDIWDQAAGVLIEKMSIEAKGKDRVADDLVEVFRRRLKPAQIERDGDTFDVLEPCEDNDPRATAWELRMKASTRPLDTVASND